MVISEKISQTKKEGKMFVKKIKKQESALIFCLEGELGAGKTTFMQGVAKELGIKEVISSPTFLLMKRYDIDYNGFKHLYHFDFYRTKSVGGLDFKRVISDPENLVFIEWGSNIKKYLPSNCYWIFFEYIDKDKRKIKT